MTAAAAPSATAPQNYLGGIALRLTAMLSLSLMFVVVQLIDASGVHILESLFWRQALVIPIIFAWAVTHGGMASPVNQRIACQHGRGSMELGGDSCGGRVGKCV